MKDNIDIENQYYYEYNKPELKDRTKKDL